MKIPKFLVAGIAGFLLAAAVFHIPAMESATWRRDRAICVPNRRVAIFLRGQMTPLPEETPDARRVIVVVCCRAG
jgi:hypothetical protein